jgi:hypothetical protein
MIRPVVDYNEETNKFVYAGSYANCLYSLCVRNIIKETSTNFILVNISFPFLLEVVYSQGHISLLNSNSFGISIKTSTASKHTKCYKMVQIFYYSWGVSRQSFYLRRLFE